MAMCKAAEEWKKELLTQGRAEERREERREKQKVWKKGRPRQRSWCTVIV